MRTRLPKYYTVLFLFVVVLGGCGVKDKSSNVIDHGTIVYHIDYPQEVLNSSMGALMPDKWLYIFSDNKIKHELKASFNVFSLNFISDSPLDSCDVLFTFMDKNLFYPIAINDHFFLYDKDAKVVVTYEPEVTKVIAGFNCSKATIKFEGHEPIDIFYTDEIQLIEPNRHTPMKIIPGVLMEFTVDYDSLKLKLTAKEFIDEHPPLSAFKIPKGAKISNKDEVVAMIDALLKTIQ